MKHAAVNCTKKHRVFTHQHALISLLFLALLLTASCGSMLDPVFDKLVGKSSNDSLIDKNDLVTITTSLNDATNSKTFVPDDSLNLMSLTVTSFVLAVTGCSSGYSKTHNSISDGATLYLYRNDTNCQAKLVNFTFEGKLWSPASGTGLVGSVPATFTAPDGKSLLVSNSNQLPNTVTNNSFVKFQFERLLMGANANLAKVGTRVIRRSGSTPEYPNLRVFAQGVNLLSLNAQKLGLYELTIECRVPVTTLGQCQTTAGTSQTLTDLKYMLLSNKKTTYTGSALNGNLSYVNFQKAFGVTSTAWGTVVMAAAANLLPSSVGFNGGLKLQFTSDLALDLNGGDLTLCVRFIGASSKNSYMMNNFTVATGPLALLEIE